MENPEKTFDGLLVLEYKRGNKKALNILVKRHHIKMYRHAFWTTKDPESSKDIVQESWKTVCLKLDALRDPNSFGMWALKIVNRKCIDHLNKDRSTRGKKEVYGYFQRVQRGETQASISELETLRGAIKLLNPKQQIVLRMFYIENFSLKEISAILNISGGTVKSRLFHAREKLKTILKTKSHEKR